MAVWCRVTSSALKRECAGPCAMYRYLACDSVVASAPVGAARGPAGGGGGNPTRYTARAPGPVIFLLRFSEAPYAQGVDRSWGRVTA